jgi:hypothetical protein
LTIELFLPVSGAKHFRERCSLSLVYRAVLVSELAKRGVKWEEIPDVRALRSS